jgi:hypothetical protein
MFQENSKYLDNQYRVHVRIAKVERPIKKKKDQALAWIRLLSNWKRIYFIIPQAKWANVVSGMVENLCRKIFLPARIGVGGCHLSVCLSACLSVCLCDFVE